MKRKTKKIIWISAGSLLALTLVILAAAGIYMVGYSLNPNPDRRETASLDNSHLFRHSPESQTYAIALREEGILRDTTIVVNGLKRHAYFAKGNEEGKTAVIVHGYKDNALTFIYLAQLYRENLGYNFILPDLYGHGLSDGDDIRMGWLDRLDLLDWCTWAKEFFGGENPQMVVHGVSMGAATTMCLSGEDTPDFIKCFVEDCGYTSVWDEFSGQIKEQFGLPAFPILDAADIVCRIKNGWGFKQASPLKAVAKCTKPMLFIHGDADTFVPFWMVEPLYEAKPEPKALYVAPGSKHAKSYLDHPQVYTETVIDFVGKYII